jgi:outer membrane protein assembly factor BamB
MMITVVYLFYRWDNYPNEPVSNGNFPDLPEWTFWADEDVTATPIVYGSNVFVRTSEAVYKIDANTGILIWRFASPGTSSSLDVSPQISGNLMIVPERGALLAAVSIETGHLVWRLRSVDANRKNTGNMEIAGFTIDEGAIYIARYDWKLTSYDLESGQKLWEANVPGRVSLYLAADHNAIYLAAGHSLCAYDFHFGQLLWKKDMGAYITSMVENNGYLYLAFLSDTCHLAAFNLKSRQQEWQQCSISIDNLELGYLTIAEGVLYGTDENLFAFKLSTGEMLWISQSAGPLERPIVAGDRIYVRNNETTMFVFDTMSGDKLGHLLVQSDAAVKEQPGRNPAIYGDLVIIPFGDERILAYFIDE